MGMDGLSMANTGALKESTSADFTNRAEQAIQIDRANDSKQVQTMSTNPRIKEKEEDEESKKQQQQQKKSDDIEDEYLPTDKESLEEDFDVEEIENPNKDFYVKLNAKDDIIELYDSSSDRLIETISGNELSELVKKLNLASGIFVNKKV
ncbi:hypothetical protein J6R97_00900 [bacterium]|nr:hypothetical protein [bacterium]